MYHENRSVFSEIHLPMYYSNSNTPRPITNASLRRTLENNFDLKLPPIVPKDEKILSLMVDRGEAEQTYWENMHRNSVQWDRASSDRSERLTSRNKLHREQIAIRREADRQHAYMRKLEQQTRRLKIRAAMMNDIYQSEEDVENMLKRQKADGLHKFIQKNRKTKKHQEKNWWKVHSDEFERKTQDVVQHEQSRSNASQKRDSMLESEVARMTKENKEERHYFTERFMKYETRATENREAINAKLERKQQEAQANHEHEMKRKEEAISRAIKKEEERRDYAKRLHEKAINESLEKANEQLNTSGTVTGSVKSKKQLTKRSIEIVHRIHTDTERKRNKQKTNTENIRQEMKRWRRQLRNEIKDREKRMEEKQEQRQELMDTARSRANSSRTLRSKVQYRYGAENFDRKVLRVQSFNSLGHHRPGTIHWNDSSNISLL